MKKELSKKEEEKEAVAGRNVPKDWRSVSSTAHTTTAFPKLSNRTASQLKKK
jgi:hypothetical protein